MPRSAKLPFIGLALAGALGASSLCSSWSDGRTVGSLPEKLIPEASGLAVSHRFGTRLYHVNDSGGGPYFYVSDLSGSSPLKIRVEQEGLENVDWEDLAVGRCGDGGQTCLFIGDLGDNWLKRETVDVIAVPEQETFSPTVQPWRRLRARYPDGPHNAEALAAHPNGDLYILTKSFSNRGNVAGPARLYRLPARAWGDAETDVKTLEFVIEIDLPALAGRAGLADSHVVTGLDISPDGERFLVLTYDDAWEFRCDLLQSTPKPAGELIFGQDVRRVELRKFMGKESVAYLPDGRSFLYGKEFKPDRLPSELIRVDCRDSAR